MAFDSRFIGFWVDMNGVTQIAQDSQSGDGFCYLSGEAPSNYALPDSITLLYPLNPQRQWKRVEPTSSGTIIGHWRHDRDPSDNDDLGEEMIFGADGKYIDFWDGDGFFYSGTYSVSQDSSGKHIVTSEYRSRLQTSGSTYTGISIDGTTEHGNYVFGVNPAGKQTVTLASSNPQIPPHVLTRQ